MCVQLLILSLPSFMKSSQLWLLYPSLLFTALPSFRFLSFPAWTIEIAQLLSLSPILPTSNNPVFPSILISLNSAFIRLLHCLKKQNTFKGLLMTVPGVPNHFVKIWSFSLTSIWTSHVGTGSSPSKKGKGLSL